MGKKVLVVDDEVEQINFLMTALEEDGYLPITASNGKEGMKKVRQEKPDLILLDILMPEQGGIAMYHDLKHDAGTKDIPVVIITAVASIDPGPLGRQLKDVMMTQDADLPAPDGYMEKPLNAGSMLKVVRGLLS